MTDNGLIDLEGKFYNYLHETGCADGDWNLEVLRFYSSYLSNCASVLDIGCGQGQFMELLTANGIAVQGVDIDAQMVQLCHSKGLSVVAADLLVYLAEKPAQFDGIFSSNVIEHLSAVDALRFIDLAYAALRPGGVFVLATPNPESLIVHLYEFWRDATHIRLYNLALLEFMLYNSGFRGLESGGNPHTVWQPAPDFAQLPELWAGQVASSLPVDLDLWQTVLTPPILAKNEPWHRRLRRRLARFLVQTVMFEEFASLVDGMQQLADGMQQLNERHLQLRHAVQGSIRTLHANQGALLTVPREIFVVGRKPEVC